MQKEIWIHDYSLLGNMDEFVNIEIAVCKKSSKYFVNPYSILLLSDGDVLFDKKNEMCVVINSFFETLLNSIINDDFETLDNIRLNLHEARYVHLGYGDPKFGKAFDKEKFSRLCVSIKNSPALESGLISELTDLSIYTSGIGDDLISD